MIYDGELTGFMHSVIQSDLYYPRYWGVLNFGLKNRVSPRYADIRGVDDRGLTVLDISWAYQILASKTADNIGKTVVLIQIAPTFT